MKTLNRKISTKKCGIKGSRRRKSHSVNRCTRKQHGGVILVSLKKLLSDLIKRIKKFFSLQSLKIYILERKLDYIVESLKNLDDNSNYTKNIEKFEVQAERINVKLEALESEEKDMLNQYGELVNLAVGSLHEPFNNLDAFIVENKNIYRIAELRETYKYIIDYINDIKNKHK